MYSQKLIEAARLRVRKSSRDLLDCDIEQLIAAAVADIKRIGVLERFLPQFADGSDGSCDPLITEAILTFVNANYGNNPDREKLMTAYDMFLTKIKGGRYFD